MNSYYKIEALDNLELLVINEQSKAFPEHYHDTYCISLIKSGIEAMKIGNNHVYSDKDSISIARPKEIHSNPLLDKDIVLQFSTVYISEKTLTQFTQREEVFFSIKSFKDPQAKKEFLALEQHIINKDLPQIKTTLAQLLASILKYSDAHGTAANEIEKDNWDAVYSLFHNNLKNKISIDFIANAIGMDKFNFAKKFKHSVGLTPMHYFMMKKVFSAKKEITPDTSLTDIAYEYDFTDMAHFSRSFKYFIGVSPKQYQKGL